MSFESSLNSVETKFAAAMDLEAGQGVKVRDIFTCLRNLSNGKYKNLTEMYKVAPFNGQNKVYRAVCTMLENMGTPVNDLVVSNGKQKLEGTQFALDLLAAEGLSLPTPEKRKKKEPENEVEVEEVEELAVSE